MSLKTALGLIAVTSWALVIAGLYWLPPWGACVVFLIPVAGWTTLTWLGEHLELKRKREIEGHFNAAVERLLRRAVALNDPSGLPAPILRLWLHPDPLMYRGGYHQAYSQAEMISFLNEFDNTEAVNDPQYLRRAPDQTSA